ncbi:MAG: O-antigen ligase family protein [Thermodesulfobacteriota bacterium]|nr:O-antigen ligase family protein [Thermodesulfobacteriota bacterium]
MYVFCAREAAVKFVAPYLMILWAVDIVRSLLTLGRSNAGIVGNQNWHAAFLVVTTTFALYSIAGLFDYLEKRSSGRKTFIKVIHYFSILLVSGVSCYFVYQCHSRGAWLGLAATIFAGVILKFRDQIKNYINLRTAIIIAGIFAIFISFQAYQYFGAAPNTTERAELNDVPVHKYNIFSRLFFQGKDNRLLKDDLRPIMWKSTVDLITDHPFVGTGVSRFESVFAPYRPEAGYFTRQAYTVRSNHPHNTPLYIAAVFGIPGFILWCFLWIYPAVYCALTFRKLSAVSQLALLGYLYLFIHGLVDLILFNWPTVVFAAIFTGILWTDTFKGKKASLDLSRSVAEKTEQPAFRRLIYPCFSVLAGALSLIVTASLVYSNTRGSSYFFKGTIYDDRNEFKVAVHLFEKGLRYEKKPKYIYRAGTICLTRLNDPERALTYFDMFKEIPQYSYAHSYASTAMCLKQLGRLKESIPLWEKDAERFPLFTAGWYQLALIQLQLGMTSEARKSFEKVEETMAIKNLPLSVLPLILKDANYDRGSLEIPEKLKESYNNSTVIWYKIAMQQKQFGMPEATVEKSLKEVEETLKKKGLPAAALPLLLKNPEYDKDPGKIPPELLNLPQPIVIQTHAGPNKQNGRE